MRKKLLFLIVILLMCSVTRTSVYALEENLEEPQTETEQQEEITLTYDANGGEVTLLAVTVVKNTKVVLSDVIPTKNGYKFLGWTPNDSTTTYKGGDLFEVNESTILYAKWSANKYNIAFNGNGATSGTVKKQTNLVFDKVYTLTKNSFKKKGYTFIGWNTKKDGTGESYSNKAEVQGLLGKNKGTITLYAQWKLTEYKITYELNGGENHENNPETYNVKTKTFTLSKPKKTGYSFKGWYSDSKFKTKVTEIKKGTTGNKKLYAKWEATKYTITYELNGGKNSTKNPTSYKITTKTFELSSPTKKGYKFEGWFLDSEFTQPIEEIVKGTTGKKTLYAKWTINTYKITYELNGGENHENNPETYTIKTNTIKLSNPKKTGYSFKGWYSDSKFKTKVTEIKKGTTGNKKLYAKWEATKYTITYELNGGKNSTKNPTSYKITTKTFELSSPTKKGYTFEGWFLDSEFTQPIEEIVKGTTGKKTLYAKWTINTYPITYELNGGENHENNPETYTIKTKTIKLSKPKKTGYSFKGWYSDSKFKTKVTEIKKGTTGTKKLYAKWSAIKYNVSFLANGGTGTTKTQVDLAYNKTYILNNNKFSRRGYKFVGWNTAADGTGTSYSNQESITNLTSKDKTTIKLYAQWEIITYTITYINDGIYDNGYKNITTYTVENLNFAFYYPSKRKDGKPGYFFSGWYLDSSFKNSYNLLESGTTGNITLYGKWYSPSSRNYIFMDHDENEEIILDLEDEDKSNDEYKIQVTFAARNNYNLNCYSNDSSIVMCDEGEWNGDTITYTLKPTSIPGTTTVEIYSYKCVFYSNGPECTTYKKIPITVTVPNHWDEIKVMIPETIKDSEDEDIQFELEEAKITAQDSFWLTFNLSARLTSASSKTNSYSEYVYYYDKYGNLLGNNFLWFKNLTYTTVGQTFSEEDSMVPLGTKKIILGNEYDPVGDKPYEYSDGPHLWDNVEVIAPSKITDTNSYGKQMELINYGFFDESPNTLKSIYKLSVLLKMINNIDGDNKDFVTTVYFYDNGGHKLGEKEITIENVKNNKYYKLAINVPNNTKTITFDEDYYLTGEDVTLTAGPWTKLETEIPNEIPSTYKYYCAYSLVNTEYIILNDSYYAIDLSYMITSSTDSSTLDKYITITYYDKDNKTSTTKISIESGEVSEIKHAIIKVDKDIKKIVVTYK